MPEIVFVDKTLAYALKHKRLDLKGFLYLKRKISQMSGSIFDIPYDFSPELIDSGDEDLNGVRVCIGQDIRQLRAVHALGIASLRILLGHGAHRYARSPLSEVLAEAGRLGMKVSLGCIDVSGCSPDEIDIFRIMAKHFGVCNIILHDMGGKLDPIDTCERLTELKLKLGCGLEYGGKNLLGLAAGNALGALKSGIYAISTSIGGVGGFPAFEEVVMGARHLLKMPVQIPRDLAADCREVLDCLGFPVARTKPIIGSNIFAHESGIHVDGVIKRSELYEPFAPEEVGLSRQIVIGKHSGRAAIEHKVRELKINIKPSCTALLLERVRSLAIRQKAAVLDEQLKQLAKEMVICEGARY
jgi:homocitrate synthase NifV